MSNTGRPVAGRRRLLGEVYSKVQTGHIVVRLASDWLERPPRTGLRVEHESSGVIGILVDIIGNVKEPFAVVKLDDRSLLDKISEGSKVYALMPRPRRRRGEERRRGRGRQKEAVSRRRGGHRTGRGRPGRGGRSGGRPRGRR